MRNFRKVLLTWGLLQLSGLVLAAQDPIAWVRSEARDVPGGEGALASAGSEITLGVTEEGAKISAILAWQFGSSLRNSFEVSLEGNLESGQQELELANSSDLPGNIQATVRFSSALGKVETDQTGLCRKLNSLLGAQVPVGISEALAALQASFNEATEYDPASGPYAPGKAQYEALELFWQGFFDAWDTRKAALVTKAESSKEDLDRTEEFELETFEAIDLPLFEELEDRLVRAQCKKWNEGRFADLLLVEMVGSEEPVPKLKDRVEPLSTECNVEQLIAKRVDLAQAIAIRKANTKHSAALQAAQATYTRELAEAREIQEVDRRQDAEREARKKLDSAKNKLGMELANSRDDLALEAVSAKAEDMVYSELADALAKTISGWNGLTAPFVVARPGERAQSQEPVMVCGEDDINAVLQSAPEALAWKLKRSFERQVPSQWFLTAEYSNSSEDFRFANAERSVDPSTGLVAIETENEHNYSGRVGVSYLRSGSLWTIGIGRKRVWSASPSVEICVTSDSSAESLFCSNTSLAPPTQEESTVYDLQWAREISPRFAFQAQIFFEDNKDVLNPHFIAFFLQDKERLRGGLDLSFREGADDSTDGFQARLFVGLPFRLGLPGR